MPSPSATVAPFAVVIEPRWVSVTAYPSAVAIVMLRPEPGTVPAKLTDPATGAATVSPSGAARSTPRCWPAAYGCDGSNTNGSITAPSTGQLQAAAAGEKESAVRRTATSVRRIGIPHFRTASERDVHVVRCVAAALAS